jgi:tetratricopeptide (TPR) repeat protein
VLLNKVISQDSKNKLAYNANGLVSMRHGKYSDALAAYDKALEIDPKWGQALNNKMHSLLALGRQSDAIKIFMNV